MLAACSVSLRQPVLHDARALPLAGSTNGPLKAHLRSGQMVLFSSWQPATHDSVLRGYGTRYNIRRDSVETRQFAIPLDSIALLETQGAQTVGRGLAALGVWTTIWGAVTAVCVADPKSCFGSCPTFYLDDVDRDRPLAEGFSSSIARALEDSDVDDLGQVRPGGERVVIRMANEAWETHAVRRVRLHAVPLKERDTHVFAVSGGGFIQSQLVTPPSTCQAANGDCWKAVAARDSLEWFRAADSTDLAAPDTLMLVFPPQRGPLGLVLGARQSFVSTFVLYQTMAYLGRKAGDWLASLERGDPIAHHAVAEMNHLIGEITIAIQDARGEWRSVSRFTEAGPIAGDVQLLPLGPPAPASEDSIRVRLTFARGNWRVGYLGLATIADTVSAVVVEPTEVRRLGEPGPESHQRPLDGQAYLVTYPGDQYRLAFDLPRDRGAYALFLETQGYYYEWMRGEWLAEEDPGMAALLILDPHAALRRMAPLFKAREPEFEVHFWASRFGRR